MNSRLSTYTFSDPSNATHGHCERLVLLAGQVRHGVEYLRTPGLGLFAVIVVALHRPEVDGRARLGLEGICAGPYRKHKRRLLSCACDDLLKLCELWRRRSAVSRTSLLLRRLQGDRFAMQVPILLAQPRKLELARCQRLKIVSKILT